MKQPAKVIYTIPECMIISHGVLPIYICIWYLIVMAIGITALSYQLIEYKNTRKQSFKKYAALGADSSQLKIMYIIAK